MITEKDLQEAIAECEGERNPDARTCMKLAAFYTIRDHLFPAPQAATAPEPSTYSYAPDKVGNTINYYSDTEFGRMIEGRRQDEIWPVVDELVSSVQLINSRLYDSFMRKIQ